MTPAASPPRVGWVDAAKGLGIVLVVVGHVIAGLLVSGLAGADADPLGRAFGWIYAFHMPAFFALAGLFAPRGVRKRSADFFADKLAGLVYPYVVWAVLQTAVQAALPGATNSGLTWRDFPRLAYDPPMQFWFLYVLLLGWVAYWLVDRAGGGAVAFLALTVAVGGVAEAAGAGRSSVLGRAGDHLPFFALGAVLAPWVGWVAVVPTWALVGVAAGGFAATAVIAAPGAADPGWPARLFFPLPGVGMTVAAAALLVRWNASGWAEALGRRSLEIYLAHVLFYAGARVVLARVCGVTDVAVHLIAGTAAGLAGPLGLAAVARGVGFPYLFRGPTGRGRP